MCFYVLKFEVNWIRTNVNFLTDLQSAAFDHSATTSFFTPQKKGYIVDEVYTSLIEGVLVAQLVEHKAENLRVVGSSPT